MNPITFLYKHSWSAENESSYIFDPFLHLAPPAGLSLSSEISQLYTPCLVSKWTKNCSMFLHDNDLNHLSLTFVSCEARGPGWRRHGHASI